MSALLFPVFPGHSKVTGTEQSFCSGRKGSREVRRKEKGRRWEREKGTKGREGGRRKDGGRTLCILLPPKIVDSQFSGPKNIQYNSFQLLQFTFNQNFNILKTSHHTVVQLCWNSCNKETFIPHEAIPSTGKEFTSLEGFSLQRSQSLPLCSFHSSVPIPEYGSTHTYTHTTNLSSRRE